MVRSARSFLLLVLLVPAAAGAAQTATTPSTEDAWGLRTTTFDTPGGRVTVYLPGDLAAGDTLSGTVVAEPRAAAGGGDRLEGVVVAVGEQEVPAAGGAFRVTVPAAGVLLALRDAAGVVAEATVAAAPAAPPAGDLALPPLGQTGRPLTIPGPFDGDLTSSAVEIGGRPAAVLAESPRRLVVAVPGDLVGPVELRVSEGGTTTAGAIRILRLDLSAPKLDLKSGERTTLSVVVAGLEGLEEPVPVQVVNDSPQVVTLEGGESQGVTIRPQDVRPDGTALVTRGVTGQRPGAFAVSAAVAGVVQPGGLLPGGTPGPVFQDAPPGTCACASLRAEDRTAPSLRSRIHLAPWSAGGAVQGVEVAFVRAFRHHLICSAGDGRCEAAPTWTVTGLDVRLLGVRVPGEPNPVDLVTRGAQPLEVGAVKVGYGLLTDPEPSTATFGADCGATTSRDRNVVLRFQLRLPESLRRAITAGEEVTFRGIEVTGRWSATGCTPATPAFTDPAPHVRADHRLAFSGWKKRP
jgi:hypothetical protein